MCISIQPFTQYFFEAILGAITFKAHRHLGIFPICPRRASQALSGQMGSIAARLYSGLSKDVQSAQAWTLAEPLKRYSQTYPEAIPLLMLVVLWVIVLLEGKPLPLSEDMSILEQVFIQVSVHGCIHIFRC